MIILQINVRTYSYHSLFCKLKNREASLLIKLLTHVYRQVPPYILSYEVYSKVTMNDLKPEILIFRLVIDSFQLFCINTTNQKDTKSNYRYLVQLISIPVAGRWSAIHL